MELPEEQTFAESKSNQPTKYGSCSSSDQVPIIFEYGEPCNLFATSYSEFLPVAAPLVIMQAFILFGHDELTLYCQGHALLVETACIWTQDSVKWFASLGLVLSFSLMSWRLVHERAFYVLMQHRIIVDLDNRRRLGFYVTSFLSLVFIHAVVHFFLEVSYGHPHPRQNATFIHTGLKQALSDPSGFVEENPDLLALLFVIVGKFLGPGVVCLIFLLNFDSLEERLLPLSKYLEGAPRRNYKVLGQTLYVPESAMRRLLSSDEFKREVTHPCTVESLCQKIFVMARKYQGVELIGGEEEDVVSQLVATQEEAKTDLTIFTAVYEALVFEWWPVKLLLDSGLIDCDSIKFQKYIGIHFLLGAFINSCGVFRGVFRMYKLSRWFFVDRNLFLSQLVFSYCVCGICMVCMLVAACRSLHYAAGICAREKKICEESGDGVAPDGTV